MLAASSWVIRGRTSSTEYVSPRLAENSREDLEGGRSLPAHDPVGERLGPPTDRIEREDEDHGAGDGPDARERREGQRPEIQEGDERGDDRVRRPFVSTTMSRS